MNQRAQRRRRQPFDTRAEPKLVVNLLPLSLSAEEFTGSFLPFEAPEQLAQLRSEYGKTHVFWRKGERIACVPLTSGAATIGTPTTFHVREMPDLVRRLVQDALIRILVDARYLLSTFSPLSFVSRKRDLLAQAAGGDVAYFHVYPQYTLDARVLHTRGGPKFGIVVDVKTRYEVDCTVDVLLAMGLDMRGRYVLTEKPEPLQDTRMDPLTHRRIEGRVDGVHNGLLILGDAPRRTQLPAAQAWMEARHENFAAALRASGMQDPEGVLRRLEEIVFELVGAKGLYQHVVKTGQWLRRFGPIPLANGLCCTVDEPSPLDTGTDSGAYRRFSPPTFIFDSSGSKTAASPSDGLERFGPFDSEVFTPKRPHIVVVTPTAFQGDVEVFLNKFKQGVQGSPVFGGGFVRKYRLSDCTFRVETFEPGQREAAAYRQACLNALTRHPRPDLAFVIIKDDHQALRGDEDPYLVAKSVFMAQGVPVQGVSIETIRVPPHLERGVPYALNNIALAAYAKLGGIPFVINAAHSLAHELVIGLGSASLSNARLTRTERVVGITTVFTADGNYLLHNTSREVSYDEYADELLTTLRTTIDSVRRRNAWQPGDPIRLIFHAFKPLKDIEARAVKCLAEELVKDFRVEFAFLHVSEHHPWMLFDCNRVEVEGRNQADPSLRAQRKGEFVPDRGYAVPLSRWEILLSVIGPKGLTTSLQGAPRPLLLKLHRESTFQDLEYLAGQLYRFTSLSWRSFFPSSKPVTVLYSDLIASLLGRLRHVRNWNPDALTTMLRTSRWFL